MWAAVHQFEPPSSDKQAQPETKSAEGETGETPAEQDKGEEGERAAEESQDQQQQRRQQQQQGHLHPGVVCDGCRSHIYGTRYKCLVCPDYDLCTSCEGKGLHVNHNMLTIDHPGAYHPWGNWGGWGWGGQCGRQRRCCPALWGTNSHPACGPRRGEQGEQPMETDQRAPDQSTPPSTEDQQKFFQGLAQVASNFLQPLGLRVNLEHVGDQQQQQSGIPNDTEVKPLFKSCVSPSYYLPFPAGSPSC